MNPSASAPCPDCGQMLPAGAPEMLCPRCLARLFFEPLAEPPLPAPPLSAEDLVGVETLLPASAALDETTVRRQARFGDYELLEEIGRGGMGIVYRARQRSLNRIVALKMIPFGPLATAESVLRFQAEAEAVAQLQHPNIVAIHEVGEQEGQHFFSMELVEGRTLAEVLAEGPLPTSRAAECLRTIALAVQHAHERGILHRDLKPANIVLDREEQPRVTDFGLAKRLTGAVTLTVTGQLIGSPNYMSPEQAAAKPAALTTRSDVYSLGAMLYHALTGRPPFQADTVEAVLARLASEEPIRLRALNPAVPRDLETICLKCLAKEPLRRYASAAALAYDLGHFLHDEPILARPAGRVERIRRWCRRKPALATTLALLHLVFLIGAVGVLWQWHRAEATAATLRKEAYAADLDLAYRAFNAGDLEFARRLLEKHLPGAVSDGWRAGDLRHWEWRFLWAQCRRADELVLGRHRGAVRVLDFSRDGRLLVTGDTEGALKLWDVAARRELWSTNPANTRIKSLALSPDGRRLAVATPDSFLSVWDTTTGARLMAPTNHGYPLEQIAFSPDGSVVVGMHWESLSLWNTTNWQSARNGFRSAQFTNSPLRRCAFAPDNRALAVTEAAGRVSLWDWHTGAELAVWSAHPLDPFNEWEDMLVTFSSDGQTLATSADDRAVRLWRLPGQDLVASLHRARGPALDPLFTADGRALLTCSEDSLLQRWDAPAWNLGQTQPSPVGGLFRLRAAPDGLTFASGGADGAVRLWRVEPGNPADFGAPVPPTDVDFRIHEEAARLTMFTAENTLWREWSLAPLKEIRTAAVPNIYVAFPARPLPDGNFLVYYPQDQKVHLWDSQTRSNKPWADAGLGRWTTVELSPDGHALAVGSGKRVLVFDVPTRRQRRAWDFADGSPLRVSRFSDDGAFLVTVSEMGRAHRLDLGTGEAVPLGGQSAGTRGLVPPVALRGDFLATCASFSKVSLYDWRAGRLLGSWECGERAVTALAFSRDGRRLAVGTVHGRVRLWDTGNRREVARLNAHPQEVFALGFLDADTLVTIGRDGIRFWRAPAVGKPQPRGARRRPRESSRDRRSPIGG